MKRIWNRLSVDIALLAVACVWGSSYLAAKELTAVTSVPTILAWRFLIASVFLGILWLWRVRRIPGRAEMWTGILLGLTQSAVLFLETFGVAHTQASNAGLIISLTVIFTPLLDALATRRWLPPSFFVAAVISVVGVALLVTGDGFRSPSIGDFLMLGAAAVRAVHVTLLGALTANKPYSSITVTLIQALVCTLLAILLDPLSVLSSAAAFSPTAWLNIVYLGLACSVFAFLVQLWAVRRTSASRASLLMGTEPIWAVAAGVWLAGDTFGWIGALGAALIVAACYVGQRIEARARAARNNAAASLVPAAVLASHVGKA